MHTILHLNNVTLPTSPNAVEGTGVMQTYSVFFVSLSDIDIDSVYFSFEHFELGRRDKFWFLFDVLSNLKSGEHFTEIDQALRGWMYYSDDITFSAKRGCHWFLMNILCLIYRPYVKRLKIIIGGGWQWNHRPLYNDIFDLHP